MEETDKSMLTSYSQRGNSVPKGNLYKFPPRFPNLPKAKPVVNLKEKPASPVDSFRDVPPVYAGKVRLLRWGHTSSAGMTLTFELMETETHERHPFKGLRAARASKTEGQRMQMVLSALDADFQVLEESVYVGEVLLLWWAEDCSEGMKLTLKLREGPDGANGVHPCDGMNSGKKSGEIMSLVAWAIDDDESVSDPRSVRKKRPFATLPPVTQSHILCRDPRFFDWISANLENFVQDPFAVVDIRTHVDKPETFCELSIKAICLIDSRAVFSENSEVGERARELWSDLLKKYENDVWRR